MERNTKLWLNRAISKICILLVIVGVFVDVKIILLSLGVQFFNILWLWIGLSEFFKPWKYNSLTGNYERWPFCWKCGRRHGSCLQH